MGIKNAKYLISNSDARKCPDVKAPEFAFIGRSNVGKSSMINMIANSKALAKTSQKPGKTQLINHFSINDGEWYIVDLPGYGYAARGKSQREDFQRMIRQYILHRTQLSCLFVLIDIRHKAQKIDLEFIQWLGENCVPFAIVFTKADKISSAARKVMVENYKTTLHESWEELPPMFITSSERKLGRDEILDFIERINKDITDSDSNEKNDESESDVNQI